MPFARPWVRLAEQKPPFRPLAPKPTRLRLEDDNPESRVRVGQGDRRPEPGEPAADDHDVGGTRHPRAAGRAGPAGLAASQ